MGEVDRDTAVWNGAVEILAAAKAVPFEHRFDAFALAFDAFVRTSGTIDIDYPEDRLDLLWCLANPAGNGRAITPSSAQENGSTGDA